MPSQLPNPVVAPPHVHELLDRLHSRSAELEAKIDSTVYKTAGTPAFDDLMRDKLVALDQDKSQFVYQLARMTGATSVVEAGTSCGVIATEKEPEKIKLAKAHWMEVGHEVEPFVELREGDLLQTLSKDLPDIDLLLLDIWAPLALPTLKLVQPKLRLGAVVIVDNTISGEERYKDLLQHLRDPESGFSNLTVPYHNGLDVSVYHPKKTV
ncbi:O-methyltransferase [Diaporthe helianthi]|uniref:O-methyltransferase n=1 Tax=Diaporthe helianthi TaxID=158607 RepID=A0A2P5HJ74_DIAHE|nr:O-methyltransferase [Diaporthe helianthi]